MSVRDDLILDISSAQRSIDALEAQVNAAFSGINIGIDTAGISQEISQAVASADTNTTVTVDTTGVSSEISRAVEVADTSVQVTADTTAARTQVNALDRDLDRTTASAHGLGIALSGAALLVGARGLLALANASSAVNEQISGSQIVFDDLAVSVQGFADSAAQIGLAEADALRAANAFGQLAISAGLADDQVAGFATTIVERAADIASLRDLDLDQTLEALRSGLVGETEPLRNLGIFLNEAVVSAEAYSSGIAQVGEELTDAQKIQARYNLILEQSTIAAGDFARTSDGLANTQRQLRAELTNLGAEAGAALEPSFLRLADTTRDDLLPALGELAEEVLPAVGSILEDLAPVLGITLDLLIAGAPLLQLTADIIGAIPAPLIAAAGGYLLFARAQKTATAVGNTTAIRNLRLEITGLSAGVGKLNAATRGGLAVAGVFALFPAIAVAAAAGADDVGAFAGSIVKLGDSLTGFGSGRADRVTDEISNLIGGLNTADTGEAQLAIGRLRDELAGLEADIGKGRLFSLGDVNIFATGGDADRQQRIEDLREQIELLETQADAEIVAGAETGRFTEIQIAAAEAQATRERGTSSTIRTLELLRLEEERQTANGKVIIDKYDGIAAAYVNVADALVRLRTEAPDIEGLISGIRLSGGRSEQTFLRLAVALDSADLSADGMADAAAILGVDVDTLSGFVDTLTGSLDTFVDAAVSGLPAVGDVIAQVQEQVQGAEDELAASQERTARDITASVSEFAAGLRDQAGELQDFRSDLQAITDAGFADVAGLLAQQGFEAGDAFADELAAALFAGNTEILDVLRLSNQAFEQESLATVAFIRDELAPEFLSVTGLLSSAITESFGSNLDFEEKIRIAAGLAKAELDPQGEAIAAIAATEGERAARLYGEALKLDDAVIEAAVAAGNAIRTNAPTSDFEDLGSLSGFAYIDGMVAAFEEDQRLKAATKALIEEGVLRPTRDTIDLRSPSHVAEEYGRLYIEGFAVGMDRTSSAAQASVRAASRVIDGLASQVPDFGVRSSGGGGAGGAGVQIDYERLAQAITAALPASSSVVVHGASVEGAHATATETIRQLRAERYRQTGFAG